MHVCDLTLLIPEGGWRKKQNTSPVTHKGFIPSASRKIITRARRSPLSATSYDRRLFELFNIQVSDQDDLPLAAVMRLITKPSRTNQFYMFADPVHLRADRDSIIMLGNEMLDIKADETDQIIGMINSHFRNDGIRLDLIAGKSWCLSVTTVQTLHTFPLSEVIGRNIHPNLPYGEDSSYWRNILNEVQMLLSTCNVNQRREARGEFTINSLWFWGSGTLPARIKSPWTTIYSNDYLVQGLAQHVDVNCKPTPVNATSWYNDAGAGKHFVAMGDNFYSILDGNTNERDKIITDLETKWFQPLLDLLKSKLLSGLTIYLDATSCYHITPRLARRWWRGIIN